MRFDTFVCLFVKTEMLYTLSGPTGTHSGKTGWCDVCLI